MNEEFLQYRKLGIIVLSKALDDICPTFHGETDEDKQLKIKERVKFFKHSEVDLDKEWRELERDATRELKGFIKERDTIFSKIAKTNNSEKVRNRISGFEAKKQTRVEYLSRKFDRETEALKKKLSEVEEGSKKHTQLLTKISDLDKLTQAKIKKTELRYNTIIKNTMNSDNSERVANRLKQSQEVWERKYKELEDKHLTKESIHNNKRMELDQIRIAMKGFVEELDSFQHWCTLSHVTLKECYSEAIRRAEMVNRDTAELEGVLTNIIAGV